MRLNPSIIIFQCNSLTNNNDDEDCEDGIDVNQHEVRTIQKNFIGEDMTKQCFYCSYPNSDNATRCINCGMELKKYWDKSTSRPRLVDERRD